MGIEVFIVGGVVVLALYNIANRLKEIATHLEKIARKGDQP